MSSKPGGSTELGYSLLVAERPEGQMAAFEGSDYSVFRMRSQPRLPFLSAKVANPVAFRSPDGL